MQELIDVIRAAIATDATTEQKATGVQACRTIVAALDTEPGKPLVLPSMKPASPLSGVSLDQLLDLAIGRLRMIATARDTAEKPTDTAPAVQSALRIPIAAGAQAVAARTARPRPAPPKTARVPTRTRPTNARAATVSRPANAARPSVSRKV